MGCRDVAEGRRPCDGGLSWFAVYNSSANRPGNCAARFRKQKPAACGSCGAGQRRRASLRPGTLLSTTTTTRTTTKMPTHRKGSRHGNRGRCLGRTHWLSMKRTRRWCLLHRRCARVGNCAARRHSVLARRPRRRRPPSGRRPRRRRPPRSAPRRSTRRAAPRRRSGVPLSRRETEIYIPSVWCMVGGCGRPSGYRHGATTTRINLSAAAEPCCPPPSRRPPRARAPRRRRRRGFSEVNRAKWPLPAGCNSAHGAGTRSVRAHRLGGPLSLRPLSPRSCKAAAPKGPAFCFLNYYRQHQLVGQRSK